MALILDGKRVAHTARQSLAQQVQVIAQTKGLIPHLAIVILGDDPPSHVYVNKKIKACQAVGVKTTLCREGAGMTEEALLAAIQRFNTDPLIHGIIVQLPLPRHINAWAIMQAINPLKDVDGLHTANYGRMACNQAAHIPATPLGIFLLLAHYQIDTAGKHCVVVGRGLTVGAPISMILARKDYPGNATVTLCHSHTKNLAAITRQADILLVAVGKPQFITGSMVKPGVIVIDVGITHVQDSTKKLGYRLQGDVAFEEIVSICSYITPVPGGVGPMTIVALLSNTLRAATQQVYTTAGRLDSIIRMNL